MDSLNSQEDAHYIALIIRSRDNPFVNLYKRPVTFAIVFETSEADPIHRHDCGDCSRRSSGNRELNWSIATALSAFD